MVHATGVAGLIILFLVLTKCPDTQGEPKTGALVEDRPTTSEDATEEGTQPPLVTPRPGRRVIVYMGNRPWFSSMYGTADASRTEYYVPAAAKPTTEISRRNDSPSLSSKESGQAGVATGLSDRANKLSSASLLASETTSNEATADSENDRSDLIGELDVNKHPPPPLPPFRGPKIEFRSRTVHDPTQPRNEDSGDSQQEQTRSGKSTPVVGANRRAALQESPGGRSVELSAARQQELADRNQNSRYFTFGPGSSTTSGGTRSGSLFAATGSDIGEASRDEDSAPFGGGDRFSQQRSTFVGGQDNRRPPLPALPPPPPPPPPPTPTSAPPTASTLGTTRLNFNFQPVPAIFGNSTLNRGDFQFETSHGQDSSAQRDSDSRTGFNSAEQRTTPPVTSQALRQFPVPPAPRPPVPLLPPVSRQTVGADRQFQSFANQGQVPAAADTDSTNAPSSAGQTLRFNFRDSSQTRTNPPPRPLQSPVTNSFVTYFTNSDAKQAQKSAPLTDGTNGQQEPRLNFRSNNFQTRPPRPPPQRPTSASFFQGPQAPRTNLRNNQDDNSRSRDFAAPNSRTTQPFRPNVFPVDPPVNSFASSQRPQSGFTSSPRTQETFSPSPRSQNTFPPANNLPRGNFQTSQPPRNNLQTARPLNSFQSNQRPNSGFSSNTRQQDSFDGNSREQNNGQSNSRAQDNRFQSFGRSQNTFQSNERPPSPFPGSQPSSQSTPRSQNGFTVNQRPSDLFQGNQRDQNTFSTTNQPRPLNSFAGADQSSRDRNQVQQRLQEPPRGRPQNSFQNVPPPRPQSLLRPQSPVPSPPAVRTPPQSNDNPNPQDALEPFRNDFQIALRQRAFSATTASPVDNDGRRPATVQSFQSSSQSSNAATRRKTNRVVFIPGNFGVTPTRRPDPYRSKLPGLAGSDYPTYSEIPFTNFKCSEQSTSGMFADVEAGCQVFHSCDNSNRQKSFLCPNGTIFKQELFTCDWWYNVDCDSSSKYFHLNAEMYTTTPRPKPRDSQLDGDRRDADSRSDSGRPRSF